MYIGPCKIVKNVNLTSATNENQLPQRIICDELTVKYGNHTAINKLQCTFESGSMTAIVGPNGGGKTTLLKSINSFIKPRSGRIILENIEKKQIAYMPQQTEIDRSFPLTVNDVVAMGLCHKKGFFKRISNQDEDRITGALQSVGLEECRYRNLNELSGGQFQRVLFARMSLQDSDVILLDEPFVAVDAPTMEVLSQLLLDWHKQGKTIVAVLHDFDIVRDYFPTTLILARDLIAWGDTECTLTRENLNQAKHLSLCWDVAGINLGKHTANV